MANPQISWMAPAGSNLTTNEGIVMGFDIGLSMEKYFTDNYAFLTGISLNNIGGKIKHADSLILDINNTESIISANSDLLYNLQYVKIPLALKFKTKEIGYFTYFGQIGLEAGINVKANISVDENDIDKADVADEVNLFDTGYTIGGGAEYSIGGSSCIVFGIQYKNGFVDVLQKPENKITIPKVAFLLGIMF